MSATRNPRRSLSLQDKLDAWERLANQVNQLLRETPIDRAWTQRLADTASTIREFVRHDPDIALYELIYAAGRGLEHYSQQHALTCLVVAELAAEWLEWPEEEKQSLALAALSMNVSMTSLQNMLARQSAAVSPQQRAVIDGHAAASARLLAEAGVTDEAWLHAVTHHHDARNPEAANEASAGPRLAEMLRRVDAYTAKLSRREARESVTPARAARDACLDPTGHPDSIGATLLRVLGLYPPGTFVELANGETAVVVKRGEKAHTPVVASVRRVDWGLLVPPMRRDTAHMGMRVKRGVGPAHVRVTINTRKALSCMV